MKHPTCQTAAAPAWTSELWMRVRRHLVLKIVGISGFTWIFFIGYFHLLRHPAYPVTLMPQTDLDRWIAFQPAALYIYLSLWFYVGIAPGLLLKVSELIDYGAWVAGLCITGLTIFYFWPTAVPTRPHDVTGFPGFAMLQGVDAAGNACPSMHVAAAMFSAIWIDHLLRGARAPRALRALNGAWLAGIAYSTLAIKQHVLLDATAGTLLGAAFAWASLRWRAPTARRGAVRPGADIIA